MQKIDVHKRKTFNKIIRLIIKDPQKGLEQFYKEYGKMIYLTAKATGCSNDQADSVLNKVLVKIWQKSKTINDINNPEGWIYIVAKNCAKDELSEVWHLELNEKICGCEKGFDKLHSKDNFEYLMSSLNEKEKSLLILRFVRGCSFKEIADCFEKPLATVTSLYYRALEKIKNFIKDKNFE